MESPDDAINRDLVRPGTARVFPLVRFIHRVPKKAYLYKPELRYFTVVDTAAHTKWVGRMKPTDFHGVPLNTRVLFIARWGDHRPYYRTFAFGLPRSDSTKLRLLKPPIVNDTVVSHNLDVVLITHPGAPSEMIGVGGQYSFLKDLRNTYHLDEPHMRLRDGVNLLRARSLDDVLSGRWQPWDPYNVVGTPPTIFDGNHTGCYDLRDRSVAFGLVGTCEFDGKMSVVHFGGRYLVYARSNTKVAGGRYVQVVRSQGDDPAGPYGSFELIRIDGYDWRGPGNIYFAAVQPHPLDGSMLLGMFPVNAGEDGAPSAGPQGAETNLMHGNTDGPSMVAIAASCDGVHFGKLTQLLKSTPVEGRTYDHPVDGFVVDGTDVHFYIHRDVPGISPYAHNSTRLVRHAFDLAGLQRITDEARRELPECSPSAGSASAGVLAIEVGQSRVLLLVALSIVGMLACVVARVLAVRRRWSSLAQR